MPALFHNHTENPKAPVWLIGLATLSSKELTVCPRERNQLEDCIIFGAQLQNPVTTTTCLSLLNIETQTSTLQMIV